MVLRAPRAQAWEGRQQLLLPMARYTGQVEDGTPQGGPICSPEEKAE